MYAIRSYYALHLPQVERKVPENAVDRGFRCTHGCLNLSHGVLHCQPPQGRDTIKGMYKRKDSYYRRAKQEGFRSRAAYKLTEIARAHKIARPGEFVVEAGAAPGGWSQGLLRLVGPVGKVAAVDILPMEPIPGEHFV